MERPPVRLAALFSLCCLLLTTGVGCSCAISRQKADRDAYAAIAGKTGLLDLDTALRDIGSIDIPQESRLMDPSDPDHPPMPLDDPLSHGFMAKMSGRPGRKEWRQFGNPGAVDNETWRNLLPKDPDGSVTLSLKSTMHLALLHSRDFQKEKEDLFLSALDVAAARYQVSPQLGLAGTATAHKTGATNQTTVLSDGTVHWVTASATDLVVRFANSFLWDFNRHSMATDGSLVSFSLVQPLLGLSAQDRILEELTFSERNLLANVRQMQQFRLGYYVRIATGRNSGEGPNPGGKVGASGLGILAGAPTGVTGAPSAGGYLGLLEETQRIQNQEANVARLRQSFNQLAAAFDAGRLSSRLQVDQARLALFNSQSSLLSAKAAYASRIDAFKVDLGLPPDLPAKIQDTLLNRFNTTNPAVTVLDRRLNAVLTKLRDREKIQSVQDLLEAHKVVASLGEPFSELLGSATADLVRLKDLIPRRKQQLAELAENAVLLELQVEASAVDPGALERRQDKYIKQEALNKKEFERLSERNRSYPEMFGKQDFESARSELVDLASDFSGLLLAISLNQTAIRLDSATLPEVNIKEAHAQAIAKEHRLDWMNARARLVDAWRQVDLQAKNLKGVMNLSAGASVGGLNNRAAVFDARSRSFTAGLSFKTTLSQLFERNNYREALIKYQQERRDYMLFEDRISQSLRNTLRIIEVSQINFEVRRAAVQVAISQVDLARLRLEEPPRPGIVATIGATTARDLVTALSDLLDAQNAFLSMRVGFDVLRLVLDFECGTMKLNSEGLWVDPGTITRQSLTANTPRWTTLAQARSSAPASSLSLSFRQVAPSVR